MPESSTSAMHGHCLYEWDGTQWVLQANGDHCQTGYEAKAPSGGPADHGNQTQNVPGTCVAESQN